MVFILSLAVVLMAGEFGPGQSATPTSFEVASVKPAAPCCAAGQWRESKAGDDRIDFRYVSLRYCIAFAYGVEEFQVSGPSWLGELRYDIVAKGAEGTRHADLPAMMQTLLAERFKLLAHHEKKEFSVFALVVGNGGPKLTPTAEESGASGGRFSMSMTVGGTGRMEARNVDMTSLAKTLPRLVGRPVVDQTALTGRYDFNLEFSPEEANQMVHFDGERPPLTEPTGSIFGSIKQIGLRLESRKIPLEVIVVDQAEKVATEN